MPESPKKRESPKGSKNISKIPHLPWTHSTSDSSALIEDLSDEASKDVETFTNISSESNLSSAAPCSTPAVPPTTEREQKEPSLTSGKYTTMSREVFEKMDTDSAELLTVPSQPCKEKNIPSHGEKVLQTANEVEEIPTVGEAKNARLIAARIRDVFTEGHSRSTIKTITPPNCQFSITRARQSLILPRIYELLRLNNYELDVAYPQVFESKSGNVNEPSENIKDSFSKKFSESEIKIIRKRRRSEVGSSPEAEVPSPNEKSSRSAKRQCDASNLEQLKTPMAAGSESFMDIDETLNSSPNESENLSSSNLGHVARDHKSSSVKPKVPLQEKSSLSAECFELKIYPYQTNKLFPVVHCVAKLTKPREKQSRNNGPNTSIELHKENSSVLHDTEHKFPLSGNEDTENFTRKATEDSEITICASIETEMDTSESNRQTMETSETFARSIEVLPENLMSKKQPASLSPTKNSGGKSMKKSNLISDVYFESEASFENTRKSVISLFSLILDNDIEVPPTLIDNTPNSLPFDFFDSSEYSNLLKEYISKPRNKILCPTRSGKESEYERFEIHKKEVIRVAESDKYDVDRFRSILGELLPLQLERFSYFNFRLMPLSSDYWSSTGKSLDTEKIRKILPFIWAEAYLNLNDLKSLSAKVICLLLKSPEIETLESLLSLRKGLSNLETQCTLMCSRITELEKRDRFLDFLDPIYEELIILSNKASNSVVLCSHLQNFMDTAHLQFKIIISMKEKCEKYIGKE